MPSRLKVVGLIFRAVEQVNLLRPAEKRLDLAETTRLYGKDGALDSLGLVGLILEIEQLLEEELGLSIVLADERALAVRRNPFRDVSSLADYVVELLEREPT